MTFSLPSDLPMVDVQKNSSKIDNRGITMTIAPYYLAGAEADRRFSPFCWRTRMALAHKGLVVETVPWRFTEKAKLPQPNAGRVPVIVDGDRVVHDSTAIADYLEEHYPDRPSLFGASCRTGPKPYCKWGSSGSSYSTSIGTAARRIRLISDARARSALARLWKSSCATARRGCRRFAPVSIRCAAPSSGRILSPAKLRPMPTTLSSARSNGHARSAISNSWRSEEH